MADKPSFVAKSRESYAGLLEGKELLDQIEKDWNQELELRKQAQLGPAQVGHALSLAPISPPVPPTSSPTTTQSEFANLEVDLAPFLKSIHVDRMKLVNMREEERPPICLKRQFPLGIDSASLVNLLYSTFNLDLKIDVDQEVIPGSSKLSIKVPVCPTGAGKTKLLYNAAILKDSLVLFTDYDSIEAGIQTELASAVPDTPGSEPGDPTSTSRRIDPASLISQEDLDTDGRYVVQDTESHKKLLEHFLRLDDGMQAVFLRRLAAQLYVMTWCFVHNVCTDAVGWLRLQMIADNVISQVQTKLSNLNHGQLLALCKQLRLRHNKHIIIAGDEAQVLLRLKQDGMMCRRESALHATQFAHDGDMVQKSEKKTFKASAFSVCCRALERLAQTCSIEIYFAGTSFSLLDALQDATSFMKSRFVRYRIKPATADDVKNITEYYFYTDALTPEFFKAICARLTGRMRPVEKFLLHLRQHCSTKQLTDKDVWLALDAALRHMVRELESNMFLLDNTVLLPESGTRMSRRDVLCRIIGDAPLVLLEKDAQTISAAFVDLDLEDSALGRQQYIRRSNEVSVNLACRQIANQLARNPIAEKAQQALADEVTNNSTDHGWLGETCLEQAVLYIGMYNAQQLATGRPLRSIRSYAMFKNLPPLFDNYTIVAGEVSYDPHKWREVFLSDGSIVNIPVIMACVNILMRPDMLAILYPLKPVLPFGVLSAGVKLFNANLTPDLFCDNFLTTDLRRLFMSDSGKDLGTQADREQARAFGTAFQGPVLRVLFVYGGVSGTVDLTERCWMDGNSHVIFLDRKDSEGIKALILPTLFAQLELAAGNVRGTRKTKNTAAPGDLVKSYIGKRSEREEQEQKDLEENEQKKASKKKKKANI